MNSWHRDLIPEFKERAYSLWLDEGKPQGRDRIHWYQAVFEIDFTFPLSDFPADVIAEIPNLARDIAWHKRETEAWDRANAVDGKEYLEGGTYGSVTFQTMTPEQYTEHARLVAEGDVKGNVHRLFGQHDLAIAFKDSESAAAIDRQIESLSEVLRQSLPEPKQDNEPLRGPTVAEFVTVRKGLGMARADAVEEVFTLWNETPDIDLHRQIEAVWPWEAAPLDRQIAFIDQLHAEGLAKAGARYVFLTRHAHPFDADKRDYAHERFEISWKNAVRRKSKAKKS